MIFNTGMVRALLAGRKTVTRRVVKLKYSNTHLEMRTDKYGTRGFWTANSPRLAPDRMDEFTPWQEIGKTVFLTREEAEAALAKEGEDVCGRT